MSAPAVPRSCRGDRPPNPRAPGADRICQHTDCHPSHPVIAVRIQSLSGGKRPPHGTGNWCLVFPNEYFCLKTFSICAALLGGDGGGFTRSRETRSPSVNPRAKVRKFAATWIWSLHVCVGGCEVKLPVVDLVAAANNCKMNSNRLAQVRCHVFSNVIIVDEK